MTALTAAAAALPASIPAPGIRQIELGPLEIRLYALSILAGVVAAVMLSRRRWAARGGDPELILEVALWSVLFGIIGGRIYHVITSWDQLGPEWWAPFAIWEGGLGIWGAVALGLAAGAVVTRRAGASVREMMDAAAPGLLLAQAIGRLGNYFNQELFGGPTDLPWALEVDLGRRPVGSETVATYHPTFLYEMLWNLAGVLLLLWIGRRFAIRAPGLFLLYVAWYSLGRLWLEQLRVDPSQEFLGQRLNFYVALVLLVGAVVAFVLTQRRDDRAGPPPAVPRRAGGARVRAARRTSR